MLPAIESRREKVSLDFGSDSWSVATRNHLLGDQKRMPLSGHTLCHGFLPVKISVVRNDISVHRQIDGVHTMLGP